MKKILVFSVCFLLILQNFLIITLPVYAEEATPSAEIVEATQSAEPTVEPSISPTITPAPALDWTENVVLDKEYIAPQNDKVRIKFNKLPNPSGKIEIKEIKLTPEQVTETGALSDTAYDISSTMENGTFEYTLTLPTQKTENVEVKSSEDGNSFVILGGVTAQTDTLTITGLNHFTIFVISGTVDNTAIPPEGSLIDESASNVIINEFVYNPSSGNEWIELFSKSDSDINLENWQLVNGNADADDLTLTGTLPAQGILVFEKSGGDGWLNNTGLESITLKDDNGQTKDVVSYKNSSFVNGQNIGSVAENQSVCRTADGGATWQVCTNPTKGWFNSGTSVATVVSAINSAGIATNLGTSDITNPSATSGLYFEKTEKGKITFSGTLNLTDVNIVSLLQNLATKLDMNTVGHIAFNASTATLLQNAGATLVMYGLDAVGFTGTPEIIVRDDSGNVLAPASGSYPTISAITFSGGNLTFSASHFSQYDAKKIRNTTTGKGFDTIQSAIDDADTLTDHTINVSAGSYSETVTVNKAIILSGSGNPSVTKFILTTHPVTISGFNVSSVEVSGSGKIQDAGVFSLPEGQVDLTDTPQINVDQQVTLNVESSGGTSSVILPAGINITKTGGGNIDSSLLSAGNTSTGSLSGLGTGVVADGALQWGIPNLGLTFSSAITLNIYVGTSFNGQTLNILRSSSTSSGWTSDGIVVPATCLVSAGICSFQATKASYYATTHTTSSSSGSSVGVNGGGDGLGCAVNDCSVHPATVLLAQAQSQTKTIASPVEVFLADVLGTNIVELPVYEPNPTPSPEPEILGTTIPQIAKDNRAMYLVFGLIGLLILGLGYKLFKNRLS